MSPKDDRLRIASIGEYYEDLLEIDSSLTGRTPATQAASLLCAKLQEREPKIKERIRYLAAKRGVSFEEMWLKVLQKDYEKLSLEELTEIQELGQWTQA